MGSLSRKLLSDSMNDSLYEACSPFCDPSNNLGYCQSPCLPFCHYFCPYELSPPPTSLDFPNNHPNKILVAVLSILAALFVLVSGYALYVKFYRNPSRRRRSLVGERNETREEFLDEDHGPAVDHPIWYINTVGLQPSVINSITVFRFKKGDGLVEGTECSVCLNEFQEDETLRLLPKCSHAFHIPCIDTWLRSHTNCPMCRAPILSHTARGESSESGIGDGDAGEGTQIEVSENGGGIDGGSGELIRGGREEGGEQVEGQDNRRKRLNAGEDGVQPIRRSVSMDSFSALKIRMAMAQIPLMESDGNSDTRLPGETNCGTDLGSRRDGGRQSLLKLMASSSSSSSFTRRPLQPGSSSSSVRRSFSCSGKLFSARYSRTRNSVLPL